MKRLEASEVAEHFTEFLEQLHARGESVQILKQGVPYAYLCAMPSGCNSHEFADDLNEVELTTEDRRELAGAIRKGREVLKPLDKPWD